MDPAAAPRGLLDGAFRPAGAVAVLRSYWRPRQRLLTAAARHVQHVRKAREQMNVKLTEVVSDITGVTGLRILDAILGGTRDPQLLAALRDRRCANDQATIAKALEGNWRDEHLFELRQALALFRFYHPKVAECDRCIDEHLRRLEAKTDGPPLPERPRPRKRHRNEPTFPVRQQLYRWAGIDLTVIEGIEETTALTVLSELGTDLSAWPTAKHFCSWLGLCPNVRKSAGQILSRRTKPCANRVAQALRLAARSLHHSKSKSALGAFSRRPQARRGAPRAITATAHKLARLIYSMLRHGTACVAQAMEAYEQQYRERIVRNLARRASELGYLLVPTPP